MHLGAIPFPMSSRGCELSAASLVERWRRPHEHSNVIACRPRSALVANIVCGLSSGLYLMSPNVWCASIVFITVPGVPLYFERAVFFSLDIGHTVRNWIQPKTTGTFGLPGQRNSILDRFQYEADEREYGLT